MANIINAIENHSDAFDAQAECKTGDVFVPDGFEDVGMDHSAAHDFNPVLAELLEVVGLEIDLETRLGEREKVGAKPHGDLRA